ncbi:nucleolar protein 12 [Moelleriella libera RCEF 2490]|uniref:Nucleolar protein 12 n=1 Tax=Moelleriella libera RCEF 2490 TaxID=1081109 RepID=A0A166UMV7_9HYPO|nr:nucleolar protein 12 [Moelleriella libera RCEF 2490]
MAKKAATRLSASSKKIDPTLDALFAASSGPVTAPSIDRYNALSNTFPSRGSELAEEPGADDNLGKENNDDELSEISEELDYHDGDESDEEDREQKYAAVNDDSSGRSAAELGHQNGSSMSNARVRESEGLNKKQSRREGKRKRLIDNEDLESRYLTELTKHNQDEPSGKRHKATNPVEEAGDRDSDTAPLHETLTEDSKESDLEKASRTIFLANVPTEAMTSKSAKKTLIAHLSSALDAEETPPPKLESIRFRSVAFSTGSMPKRAAYITRSLMNETTRSANAYAVFSTQTAARRVASKLNGTEVLGRHIRVDSVAHPSPTDHRRCVFVGNLGFIDDETVVSINPDGEKVEKKRTKTPADAEEGLWRTFGKVGKVENVRVVRDAKTRVGKGFAYVQFHDANDVEAALLLNGKKFPPMLPRILRVTRAKDPRKTALAQERTNAKAQLAIRESANTKYKPKVTPEQRAASGRADKLLGRAGGFVQRQNAKSYGQNDGHTASKVVFEGRRASSKDGRPGDLKLGKNKKNQGGRPKKRSAARAATWKKKA